MDKGKHSMNKELVSIIVPIYNTEEYLQECIDSLVHQTYPFVEIILVNDGSTDNSIKICNENALRYDNIRVLTQSNRGVSAARNQGIAASHGEYIAFVDSDDRLTSDAIEVMYQMIISYKADVIIAEMSNDVHIKTIGDIPLKVFEAEGAVSLALEEEGSGSACAKLIKKEAVCGIWFEEGKKIHEDGYFMFQCYMRQPKVIKTNKVVYWFRIRQDSSSRVAFSDKFLDMFYFLEKKKRWIEAYWPQYKDKMLKLEVKMNLNMLQLLCTTSDKQYSLLVKECCAFIRRQTAIDTKSFLKYQKRLYYVVHLRAYSLYRMLYWFLKK